MTYTMTSQNIYLSSWDTLYKGEGIDLTGTLLIVNKLHQ